MRDEIKIEFDKYIKKICKDKQLELFAKSFFTDFAKRYEGQTFNKSNFETLSIGGKEVEQDIVKKLFISKKEVSAEEVFLELLKQNVSTLQIFEKDKEHGTSDGYLDSTEKTLGIKKIDRVSLVKSYIPKSVAMLRPFGMSDKEYLKLQNQQKKDEKKNRKSIIAEAKTNQTLSEQINANYRHTLCHEFGHIFELKTFEDRKYIKNNMSNRILLREKNSSYVGFYGTEISKDSYRESFTEANKSKKLLDVKPEMFLTTIKDIGANAISETLNEEFTCLTDKTLNIEESFFVWKGHPRKKELKGDCAYNKNYDIVSLLKLAVEGEDLKNFRFNTKSVIDKINTLNISQEFLIEIQNSLISNIRDTATTKDEQKIAEIVSNLIKKEDTFGTISVLMGLSESFKNDKNELLSENYKVAIQRILIESIKNDLIGQINNPDIDKDIQFYEKLNSKLKTIDSFICYKADVKYFQEGNCQMPTRSYCLTTNLYTTKDFADNYPEEKHLVAFNELVEITEKSVNENKDNIENLSGIMTFFTEQQKIKERHQELLKKEEKFKQQQIEESEQVEYTKEQQGKSYKDTQENDWNKTDKERNVEDIF